MQRATRCPECGSDDVEIEGFRLISDESFDVFTCNNCGQEWDDSKEEL
jgi:predicted nucleic-acid-binding Zn-ribbon protein